MARSRLRRGGAHQEEDFELNIASIIDCFTVLITYLLFSASFISLGVMDVSAVSSASVVPESANPPPVNVSISLEPDHLIKIDISGAETRSYSISAKEGQWNLAQYGPDLQDAKAKWPDVTSAVLAAESHIQYREVVKVLEETRKVFPSVALGELK